LTIAAVALAATVAPAAPAPKDKVDPDAAPLQGTWEWDPAAEQSAALPRIDVERVVIKGDTLTIHYNLDGRRFASPTTFTLDPKARPPQIDFTPTEGANKGRAYLGLYEVAGGKLRLCYRGPGATRPTDFGDRKDSTRDTSFLALVRPPADK
jgi:uncharacterized protein (TIGR03067 family)